MPPESDPSPVLAPLTAFARLRLALRRIPNWLWSAVLTLALIFILGTVPSARGSEDLPLPVSTSTSIISPTSTASLTFSPTPTFTTSPQAALSSGSTPTLQFSLSPTPSLKPALALPSSTLTPSSPPEQPEPTSTQGSCNLDDPDDCIVPTPSE